MLTIFVTNYWQLFTLRLLTGIALGGAVGRRGGQEGHVLPLAARPASIRTLSSNGIACLSMAVVFLPCRFSCCPPSAVGPHLLLQARCRLCSRCWATCTTPRAAPACPAWCRQAGGYRYLTMRCCSCHHVRCRCCRSRCICVAGRGTV